MELHKEAIFGHSEEGLTVLRCSSCFVIIKTSKEFNDEEIECCQGMVTLPPQHCKKCLIRDKKITIFEYDTVIVNDIYKMFLYPMPNVSNSLGYISLTHDQYITLLGASLDIQADYLIANYDKIIWH